MGKAKQKEANAKTNPIANSTLFIEKPPPIDLRPYSTKIISVNQYQLL